MVVGNRSPLNLGIKRMDGEGFEPFWWWAIVPLLILVLKEWMEKDSNLRRRCQQIYSLPPLATRESIHES